VVNLGQLVERLTPSLRELAGKRGAELDASRTMQDLAVAIEAELADRMIFRLCSAVIECAGEGERLRLTVDRGPRETCRVVISRPQVLRGLSDNQLFGTAEADETQTFWLRLTRGLARIAGASLSTTADSIALIFPRA